MSDPRTIRCFVSARGVDEIDAVYKTKNPKAQAKFETRMSYLAAMAQAEWKRPYAAGLKDKCAGLVEIRFEVDNVQERPIGYFGPGRGEFTLLIWAIEKGSDFVPKRACEIAQERRKKVDANPDIHSRICSLE